jgi:hypothetical protein
MNCAITDGPNTNAKALTRSAENKRPESAVTRRVFETDGEGIKIIMKGKDGRTTTDSFLMVQQNHLPLNGKRVKCG